MRMVRVLLPGFLVSAGVAASAALLATTAFATTAPAAPDAPSSVKGAVSSSTLTVTWRAPADNGSPLESYTLTEQPNGLVKTVDAPATSMSVNLGTSCYTLGASFSLFATNAVGNSTPVTVPISGCGGGVIVNPSPSATPSPPHVSVRARPVVTAVDNGRKADVLTLHDLTADGTKVVLTVNGREYHRVVDAGVARVVIRDHNGDRRTTYVVTFNGIKRVLRVR